MNGHEHSDLSSNENVARMIAYLSPVLFWGMVGAIAGGIWILH